jgi:hypothetical protein
VWRGGDEVERKERKGKGGDGPFAAGFRGNI